ncbi:hypothetical protein Q5752_005669 [Cryptotrichosporon argae]
MSLRPALRSAASPLRRLFSSTPLARDGGFEDFLSAPSSAAPLPLAAAPTAAPSGRGYQPGALPPKVDPTLDLFTNLMMKHGKKAEAQRRVSSILTLLQRATNQPPVPLLERAIALSSPSVRMLSMRKAAKTVQTPRALNERQRARQGIVWLLKAAERGRGSGVRREDRVAREILAVLEGSSDVFRRIEEVHRLAMMNRSNLNTR